MKKTNFLFTLIFLSAILVKAQPFTYLDKGNVKALVYANGELFQDKMNTKPGFEVPKDSNSFSIYASAIWFTSVNQKNGNPEIAGSYETYGSSNILNIGPVDIVNQQSDNSMQFQRLWKVNQDSIDYHIQNWNSPNYTAPAEIIDWPGNGNNNTAQNLAPYADLDNNNVYEPKDGEYPIIKGDQAVYLIANDYRPADSISSPSKIYTKSAKVEMHMMLYAFDHQTPSVANTVFVNVKLYNRSNSIVDDHNDFKISIYADFDLGYPVDDYVGTDTNKNFFYAYNGDHLDENYQGRNGYGVKLATQAVKFLDHDLRHSLYFNNSNASNGDPDNFYEVANYQRNQWKNGQSTYFSGDGFNYCVDTNQSTKFMFSGNPTLINDTTQWTESNSCVVGSGSVNAPGDRRMIGGPDTPSQLHHGDMIEFDYAYVFARDDDTSYHISDPVAKLFLVSDTVQVFYDTNILTSIEQNKVKAENHFKLFPNPTTQTVNLAFDEKHFEVFLYDINGRLVKRLHNQKQFSVDELTEGLYFLRIETKNFRQTEKLIIKR
ncbi:MAG: T9SS type A sorting domain-containing protein [Vicingaceae bacterium]